MEYLTIDLETTGLDPQIDKILEIGMVLDGSRYYHLPLRCLPRYSRVVPRAHFPMSPFVAAMHCENNLFNDLNDAGRPVPFDVIWYDGLETIYGHDTELQRITVCGKNVSGFDIPFIKSEKLWNTSSRFKFNYRTLDPGSMFVTEDSTNIPSTEECLEMAGLKTSSKHRALGDCYICAALVRFKFGRLHPDDANFLETML